MTVPPIFATSCGLFYDNLAATGAGLVPTAKLGPVNAVIGQPLDPNATLAYRDTLVSRGIGFWLFTDPHWYAGRFPSSWRDDNGRLLPDPLLYRRQVSTDTLHILRAGDPVVLDFEKCPHAWQQEFLIGRPDSTIWGWRGQLGFWEKVGANEWRETAFSNEPHQDSPADLYQKANAVYLPQLYAGSMEDVSPWAERDWLARDGFQPGEVFPVYDAADVQPEEIGAGTYLFNQNRYRALWT